MRVGLVFLIVVAIVGTAWLLGQREGFGDIGQGGINADLLPKVGEPAPEFVTMDLNGQVIRLSDFKGQPVWLNFWGSWCPPCRSEFPEIEAAYKTLQPQGLVMLGVAIRENPYVALDYANRVGGTFPIVADPAGLETYLPDQVKPEFRKMIASYTINNYPTHIFIDRDGIVRSVVISPMSYEMAVAYGEGILGPVSATPPT